MKLNATSTGTTSTPAIFSTKNLIIAGVTAGLLLYLGIKTKRVYKRTKARIGSARKEYIKRRISSLTQKL